MPVRYSTGNSAVVVLRTAGPWIGFALIASLLSFVSGCKYSSDEMTAFDKMLGQSASISDCMSSFDVQRLFSQDDTKARKAYELCYSSILGQGQINDFRIRRLKFIQQTYDERILLWMVVIITNSGVLLAAVQLGISYRLATLGKGTGFDVSEISLERTKMSMKSSVTGLIILFISLAFFLIFVMFVFKIDEVKTDKSGDGNIGGPTQQNGYT